MSAPTPPADDDGNTSRDSDTSKDRDTPEDPGTPLAGLPAGPRRGSRRRTLAVVAGVLVLLVVAALVVSLTRDGGKPAPAAAPSPVASSSPPGPAPTALPVTTSPDPQTLPYLALHPGDCFDLPAHTGGSSRYSAQDCHKPHDGEVVALLQLPGGLSTGPSIEEKANSLCHPLTGAVWEKQSHTPAVDEGTIWPDPTSYRSGRHTVTCTVQRDPRSGRLTAPLR